MSARLTRRFDALARAGRAGLVTFVTAGDPDYETGLEIVRALPQAGADVIELGMPFTDPMADGPAIQEAGCRALDAGMTLARVLDLAAAFRAGDADTPVVLMGYINPILAMGLETFTARAAAAGVDGLIVVDMPPEEDAPLRRAASAHGLDLIRLATPTTDDDRLVRVLDGASGFLYYVSVAGVTGSKSAAGADIDAAVARLRRQTDLPIAVGFGIRTADQAGAVARSADAAVVGSAIVNVVKAHLGRPDLVDAVSRFVADLSAGVRAARKEHS
ncbi:tryptophan synthase subunit alpha [Rhodothalassium salexigens]|uniref:tryptophan synthase subunit alpha n=1 Tax=Rhodothalassium salexigens TaxID=1086 RepID=UPI00191307B0|nr:tryptophan synthase subunit alpha [Rhodothalassium salexigens]MBK5910960.1 tryptophan synthase subunit alpha [Rhodothalassium salexigens]MBK5921261.1 tryptophan synthase subunit alpha [Rhodothalassium salexigens]